MGSKGYCYFKDREGVNIEKNVFYWYYSMFIYGCIAQLVEQTALNR